MEMMKSPPSRASASHSTPSPSSTISESHSPPLAISTRKPRTRRKRPNQTYDEAAALLSTAYPNIFSSKNKTPSNPLFLGIKSPLSDYDEASELLLPFESTGETDFLFSPAMQTKQDHFSEHKEVNTGAETDDSDVTRFGIFEDFDAESILDEEVEEGIDSIMGNIESNDGENHGESGFSGRSYNRAGEVMMNPWYGSSVNFGFAGNFQPGLGLRNSLREGDDDLDWCRFPTVEFEQISPRIEAVATAAADDGQSEAVDSSKSKTTATAAGDRKKKRKKKVAPPSPSPSAAELKSFEQRVSLSLNLDYNGVLEAWSDKALPFSDEILGLEVAGIDVHVR